MCKFARSYFSKLFKDISTYGYWSSKKETYFGLKLHALVATNGFITNFIVTAANVDDREVVFELVETNNTLKILGDKVYISNELKAALAKEKIISIHWKNRFTMPYQKHVGELKLVFRN